MQIALADMNFKVTPRLRDAVAQLAAVLSLSRKQLVCEALWLRCSFGVLHEIDENEISQTLEEASARTIMHRIGRTPHYFRSSAIIAEALGRAAHQRGRAALDARLGITLDALRKLCETADPLPLSQLRHYADCLDVDKGDLADAVLQENGLGWAVDALSKKARS